MSKDNNADKIRLEVTKERFKNWIKNENYIFCLNSIENFIKTKSNPNSNDYYTPHAYEHCFAVEKIVKALIKNSNTIMLLALKR